MALKVKKATTYPMRVQIEIQVDNADRPERGGFIVEVPVPTRSFVEKINELTNGGKTEQLHDLLIGPVRELIDAETGEEFDPQEARAIVTNDYRLANAVFRQYRADMNRAASKN